MPAAATRDDSDSSSDDEITPEEDLTQACFILHRGETNTVSSADTPAKRTVTPAKRKRSSKHESLLPLPPCINDEPTECGLWRAEAFNTVWEKIEESVKEVFDAQNNKVFKDIQKFVHDAVFSDAQLELYLSANTSKSSARNSKQLHAALLFLRNVDSSDHTNTFVDLKHYLSKNDCHVANLLPHNFSSRGGVSAPLHNMLKQIVKINPDTADMDILASWHRDPTNSKSPIVIIIQDAELCNSSVLTDFIVTLSEWKVVLPLILLMGVATSGDAMRKLLPASAARHLHVHTFTLPTPNEYLEGIIKEVLLNPDMLFGISCDSLRFLLGYYQKYDSTAASFLRALKMACMEHFWSQPLSFLCNPTESSNQQTHFEDISKSVNGTLLQYAFTLPSANRKENGDCDFGKALARSLLSLKDQKTKWSMTLQCLLAASKLLAVDSMKILSEVLDLQKLKQQPHSSASQGFNFTDALMMGQIDQSSATTNLFRKLRDAQESVVQKILRKWLDLTESVNEWRVGVQSLLNKLLSEPSSESFPDDTMHDFSGSQRRRMLLSSMDKSSTDQLKEGSSVGNEAVPIEVDSGNLSESRNLGNPTPKKRSNIKAIGKMVANYLEQMIKEYLVPVELFPFHEIICHKEVETIKQALIGESRRLIQKNVQYAQTCLQCECCYPNNEELTDAMNDTSILFCLAQRHGDQANLYDLYQSFSTVLNGPDSVEQGNTKKCPKSPKKPVQKEIEKAVVQARFCKAASELQLVGLFRMPTKKRPDFVQLAL